MKDDLLVGIAVTIVGGIGLVVVVAVGRLIWRLIKKPLEADPFVVENARWRVVGSSTLVRGIIRNRAAGGATLTGLRIVDSNGKDSGYDLEGPLVARIRDGEIVVSGADQRAIPELVVLVAGAPGVVDLSGHRLRAFAGGRYADGALTPIADAEQAPAP